MNAPLSTVCAPSLETHEALQRKWCRAPGLLGWFCTTNHKDIGRRYIVTAFVFFLLGGLLALGMRIQLAVPGNKFLGPDLYNQFFSTHGSTMMFLFAIPVMEGIALMMIPLLVGTRNVAFPRMNACGYFIYLAGGILLYAGLFLDTAPDAGWFSYVPLAGPEYGIGKRTDLWSQMITMTEIAALIGAVEIIVTIFKQRAPGMSLPRMPIYLWAMLVTAFMVIFAMPAIMLASNFISMDRLAKVNTQFFNPAEGGDVLLYQHIFWFFGHPEVYIIFLPATGFVSTIVQVFSGRPLFGYTALVLSLVATAFLGFGLWVHHMFATPIPEMGRSFFTAASAMIAIPSGIQFFCWIATLGGGRPRFAVPLLFVLGFFFVFLIGGLSGVMLASVPIDLQAHDTYFVVAHFHYVLIGGAVFPLFGIVYYWFPKWTGRMLGEILGRWHCALFFVGFNLTFFPMHLLGLHGMTRRVYTYAPEMGWGGLNLLASLGAAVMGVAVFLFLINVVRSLRSGALAGPNPWNASTLEWAVASPPPSYNFYRLPTVAGRDPLWEEPERLPVVVGLDPEKREVLTTTILDAGPEHRYELAGDSIWPFLLALVVAATLTWVLFEAWAIPIGAAVAFAVFWGWFWRGNEPKAIAEASKHPATEEKP